MLFDRKRQRYYVMTSFRKVGLSQPKCFWPLLNFRECTAMAIVHLGTDNFSSTVSAEGITLIDCWASWCGACADFEPIYRQAAERHPDHTFGKLDTQAEKRLVKELGIEHIPSLLLYRDGILLFRQPGYYSEEKLEDIVQQAESLDMNEVRAHIAAEQKEKSNHSADRT